MYQHVPSKSMRQDYQLNYISQSNRKLLGAIAKKLHLIMHMQFVDSRASETSKLERTKVATWPIDRVVPIPGISVPSLRCVEAIMNGRSSMSGYLCRQRLRWHQTNGIRVGRVTLHVLLEAVVGSLIGILGEGVGNVGLWVFSLILDWTSCWTAGVSRSHDGM